MGWAKHTLSLRWLPTLRGGRERGSCVYCCLSPPSKAERLAGWGRGRGRSEGVGNRWRHVQAPITSCTHTHTAGKTPHLYSHSILGLLERKEARTGSPISHISPHRLLARYQLPGGSWGAPKVSLPPAQLPGLSHHPSYPSVLQEEHGLHQDTGHQRLPGVLCG